jgi:beta-glucosidase
MTEYDISKGFTYMYLDGEPEFAFGRGLSYTTFDYSNFGISSGQIESSGSVQVRVDVRNTGQRAGDEVVQMYVHKPDTGTVQPKKQLQGFERIHLMPGETKTVTFSLPAEQLASWDTNRHAYAIHPGTFNVMVGSASDDLRAKGSLEVTTAGSWPPSTLTTRTADGDYATSQK